MFLQKLVLLKTQSIPSWAVFTIILSNGAHQPVGSVRSTQPPHHVSTHPAIIASSKKVLGWWPIAIRLEAIATTKTLLVTREFDSMSRHMLLITDGGATRSPKARSSTRVCNHQSSLRSERVSVSPTGQNSGLFLFLMLASDVTPQSLLRDTGRHFGILGL